MREELNDRLEEMVSQVNDVINDKVSSELHKVTLETDELYVCPKQAKHQLVLQRRH